MVLNVNPMAIARHRREEGLLNDGSFFSSIIDRLFMMTLIFDREAFQLPVWLLMQQCELFAATPTLLDSIYHVKSQVHLDVFRFFLGAVNGISITITSQNLSDLSQLCSEFGFNCLANQLSAFRGSPSFKEAEADARICDLEKRLAALEQIVNLQMPKQEQEMQRLNAHSALVDQIRSDVRALKTCRGLMDSLIVSDFPSLFDEFRLKKWNLLWRGSRDGFDTGDFHSRCDGHANTVTLIEDVGGFVFGGFTPVEWESRVWNKTHDRNNCYTSDDSEKSLP
jgi:hypothetical protein